MRGCINASGYFDWKDVVVNPQGGLSQFAPLIMIAAMYTDHSLKTFNFFITILKFSLILIPFQIIQVLATDETYARIIIPVTALLLILPYLPYKKKMLILSTAVIALLLTIGWRTNELRILLIFAFLLFLNFRKFITTTTYNIINIMLFCIPLSLLIISIITGKTIFEQASTYNQNSSMTASGQEADLQSDTRTLLYTEVLSDLIANNNLLFGKGATGKYKTTIFIGNEFKNGRANVEVGVLKILIYSGLTGMTLLTFLLINAIYYGTNRSYNSLTKFFSFFLALHWSFLFIENDPSYNIYNYIIWLIIGLCLSKRFRQLSDADIRAYFSKPKLPHINPITLKRRNITA